MLQVPNPTGYKGVVIAKRRADAPITAESIVYAYTKIVQKRRPVVASEVILGLAEDKDRVTRYPISAIDAHLETSAAMIVCRTSRSILEDVTRTFARHNFSVTC